MTSPPAVIAERFGLAWAPDVLPHCNIAPRQTIPAVRNTEQGWELALFGMAGLWEHWVAPDGQVVESCTIVTVDANAMVAELHDRMPLILAPADYDAWLDASTEEAALPRAVPPEGMVAYPVSPLVSNAKNDVPACLAPIDAP